MIPLKCDLHHQPVCDSPFAMSARADAKENGSNYANNKAKACNRALPCPGGHGWRGQSVERKVLLLACHSMMSIRIRFLSSLPTLVLGISVTMAI